MSGERHGETRMRSRDSSLRALRRQLQRVASEGRPGACVGCGFENRCVSEGCAVLRKISRVAGESDARIQKGEHHP